MYNKKDMVPLFNLNLKSAKFKMSVINDNELTNALCIKIFLQYSFLLIYHSNPLIIMEWYDQLKRIRYYLKLNQTFLIIRNNLDINESNINVYDNQE